MHILNTHKKFEILLAGLATHIYRWKYMVLGCAVLITAALASQMVNLEMDTRDESFFHSDDPALTSYNGFRDTFGQDDAFIIALRPRKGFSLEFFDALYRLHHELEDSIPHLDNISSLINGRIVRAEGDTLIVEELMEEPPRTDDELKRALFLMNRHPLYENLLISEDRSITSILIKSRAVITIAGDDLMEGFDEKTSGGVEPDRAYLSNEENVEITEAIHKVAAKYRNKDIDIYFTGVPAFVAEFQNAIGKDLGAIIPLSFIIIILFLTVLFRRITGVIYPLLIVFFSLVVSLGVMALIGTPITLATQILPLFLIVVGIGDSVHILTIFYRIFRETNDKREAIIQAVGYAGLPVVMTSLTTACGLLSFIWADVGSIAQLGLVAPIGVLLAMFYTLVLLPALIAIFPIKRTKPISKSKQPFVDRLFSAISRVTTRRPAVVILISAAIVICIGCNVSKVRFSHNAMTWFPENAPIRASTELLDKVNGGTVILEATIDSGAQNGLHDPVLLQRMDEAAALIPGLKVHDIQAAKAWSVADALKEINRALNEDNNQAYIVPDNRRMIAQEILLFESSGSDDLEDLMDGSRRIGRLSILAPFADAVLYKDYMEKVKSFLNDHFQDATVSLTGHMVLVVQVIENFITSMVKSYLFALLVITLLMMLMVGRVRIGLLSMVANVVPIIAIFGVMGILDIPVDMSTILVGSIVLGLVVDDTIHFLHHFRRAYDETSNVEAAVRETLFSTGRALVITSMVLCGGFSIYMISDLANNIRFGLLVSFAVLFALAADFFLMPALLSLVFGKESSAD